MEHPVANLELTTAAYHVPVSSTVCLVVWDEKNPQNHTPAANTDYAELPNETLLGYCSRHICTNVSTGIKMG